MRALSAFEQVALQEEAEQLRKDAERYRWLANDSDGNAQDDFIMYLRGYVLSRDEFDEAIDAAIAAEKERKK